METLTTSARLFYSDEVVQMIRLLCMQDNSEVGIRATLSNLMDVLREKDPALWEHLVIKNQVRRKSLGSSASQDPSKDV